MATEYELLRVVIAERDADSATVRLEGELDVSTRALAQSQLDNLIAEGISRITLALDDLQFIDSTGLSTLVAVHSRLQPIGGCLEVRQPQPGVAKVMEISGLSTILRPGEDRRREPR